MSLSNGLLCILLNDFNRISGFPKQFPAEDPIDRKSVPPKRDVLAVVLILGKSLESALTRTQLMLNNFVRINWFI